MDPQTQKDADERYDEALRTTGALDPRQSYRGLLRELKERAPGEYEDAVAEYRESVLGRIARGEASPLDTWLEFGLRLAERLHPGRAVVLDHAGRARPYAPPPSWKDLILHLPEDRKVRAIPVGRPPDPTPAQSAAIDILVLGKLKLEGS